MTTSARPAPPRPTGSRLARRTVAAALIGVGAALATAFVHAAPMVAATAPDWLARMGGLLIVQVQIGVFVFALVYAALTWLSGRAPTDPAQQSAQVAPLAYAAWALPVLGFVGTVFGISQAIGPLELIVADGAGGAAAMAQVLGGLRYAFDTTLVGLIAAMPVTALGYWLDASTAVRAQS